jgi:hypothetical protein
MLVSALILAFLRTTAPIPIQNDELKVPQTASSEA